jgi:FKBP-type peptidyl-prolyl cis-trans isomerase SlyD
MADHDKVQSGKVVSFDYKLFNGKGELVDSSAEDGPLTYIHGQGQIVPGLEKALEGKAEGEGGKFSVPPEEGYGLHNAELVFSEPRDRFDFQPEVGQVLQATMEGGETLSFQVIKVENDAITLDGNHPMAGETLNFEVSVLAVRDATPEEIAHGHVHGPGGHHH